MNKKLSKVDHIAIQVDSISRSLDYYTSQFGCKVIYNDETWALIEFSNIKIALVMKAQHPNHFAIVDEKISENGHIKYHRDGVGYIYVVDPDFNYIEIIDRES